MMEFFEKREPVKVISLFINGIVIKKSENAKFVGLTLYAKLNWITRIHTLSQNVPKTLTSCVLETLLRIYRALIRSKIDYVLLIMIGVSNA